ncbi:peptidoglycan-binding protein [Streptomyces sp. NBC_00209]|uniref:peptidoglycan-binding domain-containing protein n=1 Tax=Streptomyces sp. NBC_00209 TaxID=2975682 RepID=UPI0032560E83
MSRTQLLPTRWFPLAVGAATAATLLLGTAAEATSPTPGRHGTATARPAASAYYTPSQAKAKLRQAGITWRASKRCEDKNRNGCTSFQGIRRTTVDGVIDLRHASHCWIVITGAAEIPPHKTEGAYTHGKGYKVDIALGDCINKYIVNHSRTTRGSKRVAGTVEYLREGNHWDITYRPTGSTAPASRAWPTLRSGSRGHAVATAQQLLGVKADGRYGPATARAVKAFQRGHRLGADGIVGPATWQRLAPTLRTGAHGTPVRALQTQLRRHGARIGVDGAYGKATAVAVRAFQRGHRLTADGITGPTTWQRLLTTG